MNEALTVENWGMLMPRQFNSLKASNQHPGCKKWSCADPGVLRHRSSDMARPRRIRVVNDLALDGLARLVLMVAAA